MGVSYIGSHSAMGEYLIPIIGVFNEMLLEVLYASHTSFEFTL